MQDLRRLEGVNKRANNPLFGLEAVNSGRGDGKEGRGEKERLVLEEFAQHLERIGGVTRLAMMGESSLVIQGKRG